MSQVLAPTLFWRPGRIAAKKKTRTTKVPQKKDSQHEARASITLHLSVAGCGLLLCGQKGQAESENAFRDLCSGISI